MAMAMKLTYLMQAINHSPLDTPISNTYSTH